jgi:hypothetical protein
LSFFVISFEKVTQHTLVPSNAGQPTLAGCTLSSPETVTKRYDDGGCPVKKSHVVAPCSGIAGAKINSGDLLRLPGGARVTGG